MLSRLVILLAFLLCLPVALLAQEANEEYFAAARRGDLAAVKAFLDKGVDVNAKTRYGATALAYACDKGHVEIVRLLIERGANVNVEDTFYHEVPIGWAVGHGHIEIVKMLLDKGAKGIERVLSESVTSGNKDMVRVALDKGGISAETLTTALAKASKDNKAEIADMLKKAGAAPPPPIDAATLESYAGKYKAGETDIIFALKEGRLVGGVPGQQPFTLGPINKTTFTPLEFDGASVVFNVEAGKVTSLTWKAGGRETKFNRVEQ